VRDVGDKELRNRKQSILGNLAMDEQTIEEHVARKLLEYFTDESPTGVKYENQPQNVKELWLGAARVAINAIRGPQGAAEKI
jgi:hypothetical protein